MKLLINEGDLLNVDIEGTHELCSSVAQTVFYFIGVTDWKGNGEKKPVPEIPIDIKEKLDASERSGKKESNLVIEEKIIKEPKKKHLGRPPKYTGVFLDWIKAKKENEFELTEFVNEHPELDKEQVDKIISYLIRKENLLQLSNTKFTKFKFLN